MYKEANKIKLRISTSIGLLSSEQLWDLSISDLDTLAIELQKLYKESGKKSFVVKSSRKDKLAKLRFDIVLDVLTTKVEEMEGAKEQREAKEFNEKIMRLIAEKEEDSLKDKSVSELKKMLKK